MRRSLYHYTDSAGLAGIVGSGRLLPSTAARNPRDVRYGEGVYLSDIEPGSISPARLSRRFLGQPFQGQRFTHYIEVQVDGWEIREGRPGVYVVPTREPLELTGRIIRFGAVPQTASLD